MGTCVWQILTIIDHWLVTIWGRTLQYKWIVKCHGKEMAICRWILYDELKWLNSLLAKAIRHARHVLKSVCDWLWAFQMCAWTKICVPQLVGGLEHVLFFHNILNNPSHWLSYFSEGLKPPTRQNDGFCWMCLPHLWCWNHLMISLNPRWSERTVPAIRSGFLTRASWCCKHYQLYIYILLMNIHELYLSFDLQMQISHWSVRISQMTQFCQFFLCQNP